MRLLLPCLLLCACSGPRMVQTDLYFGQLKPGGGKVSEQEWNAFAERHIGAVFANGSTVTAAMGNWYDTALHRLVREPSYIVTSVNRMTPRLNRQIDSLRGHYKTLFRQQSVLRVDRKATVKLF
ncbi:DUF3574 domain-containing protein [Paraflavisolibacter sp. H34]|uniref:DUF3574 domain-containing protein n=1 Tax=Huijunlia imazamoxiresistens TaxID=3127457 RepID=UPI0030163F4A